METGTHGGVATGLAPGKLILVGEHAVVHGERAVAMPMGALGVAAYASPTEGPLTLDSSLWSGPLARIEDVPAHVRGLSAVATATLERLGEPHAAWRIRLSASLPVGAGLGSSAAVAVAVVRALFAAYGRDAEPETLFALADLAERHAHGTPSGLDVRTVAASGPIAFRRGEPPVPLAVAAPLTWLVADTGEAGDTARAVAAVASRLEAEPEARERLRRLGALSERVVTALSTGDAPLLGATLDQAHDQLVALGVSSPALDRLVEAARGTGALGAKLTGAGQGGCMLALAPDPLAADAIERALTLAGARAVWRLTLPATGTPVPDHV